MHRQAFIAVLLAAGSELVLASTSNATTNVNGDNNNTTGGKANAETKHSTTVGRRALQALFARDAGFEDVMQELSRRAKEGKDVDQMVNDIKTGKTPQPLVAAANRRGLTKNVEGFQGKNAGNAKQRPQLPPSQQPKIGKRATPPNTGGAAPGKGGVIDGPKGQKLPVAKVVDHVDTKGSYIPDKVKTALQESDKFLAKGQYSSAPTAKPLQKRDINGEILHVRADGAVSTDEFNVLINSMKRDDDAKQDILNKLNSTDEVKNLLSDMIKKFVADCDGKVNFKNMKKLVKAMNEDPKAEQEVLEAFNKNEQIAKTTLGLFDRWTTPEDVVRRDPDEEFEYLARRSMENEMLYLGLKGRNVVDTLDTDSLQFEARDPVAEASFESFDDDEWFDEW